MEGLLCIRHWQTVAEVLWWTTALPLADWTEFHAFGERRAETFIFVHSVSLFVSIHWWVICQYRWVWEEAFLRVLLTWEQLLFEEGFKMKLKCLKSPAKKNGRILVSLNADFLNCFRKVVGIILTWQRTVIECIKRLICCAEMKSFYCPFLKKYVS